ncbi:ETC complex I subunit [Robiginitomaculum antarcticum]|uniref:ETC complex I subunit n=1 Tax=Robiginitomaculum antarcticum TaxID=437507 RepID=UPI0003683F68|nr:ETC complex I subunit [Robiginitomaculum antarcticum]
MFAKIYQPARSAMQSGLAHTQHWLLEFMGPERRFIDPLTGTASSTNTLKQVELKFENKDDAIAYVKARNIPYQVKETQKRTRISRSYAENFDYDRKLPWTH